MSSGVVTIGGGIAVKQMGRGDSNSGLTLDENEFNLVDKHKIFIWLPSFFYLNVENKIFKN